MKGDYYATIDRILMGIHKTNKNDTNEVGRNERVSKLESGNGFDEKTKRMRR